MRVRRNTDSVYLQYIWDALEVPPSGRDYTFEFILNFVKNERDSKCDRLKLQKQLDYAIRDKCVTQHGQYYRKADWNQIHQSSRHDSYCFICHQPGPIVDCPTCFRVFHEACLPRAFSSENYVNFPDESFNENSFKSPPFPPSGPCPTCRRLTHTTINGTTNDSDLASVYSVALEKMRTKNPWKTLCTVGYVNEPKRNDYFGFKEMNTMIISEKLRSGTSGYRNRAHIMADLDIMVHNAAVIYGPKAEMTNTARQLRTLLQKELRESSLCVDCYLRSKGGRLDARQNAEACRKAHPLIWFQFSSWSFRPCKVLYKSSDGYEVICFDGRRERLFVPERRASQMTFTATQLGMRMTAVLKRALDDAERYTINQRKVTPDFPFAEGLKHDDIPCASPATSTYSTGSTTGTRKAPSTTKTSTKRRREPTARKQIPASKPGSAISTPTAHKSLADTIFGCGRTTNSPTTSVSSLSLVGGTNTSHRSSNMVPRVRRGSFTTTSTSDDDDLSSISSSSSSSSTASSPPAKRHNGAPIANRYGVAPLPTNSSAVASDNSTTPATASSSVAGSSRTSAPSLTAPRSSHFFNRRHPSESDSSGAESSPLDSNSPPPKKSIFNDPLVPARRRALSTSSSDCGDSENENESSQLESSSPPVRHFFGKAIAKESTRAAPSPPKASAIAAPVAESVKKPGTTTTLVKSGTKKRSTALPQSEILGKATPAVPQNASSVSSVSPAAMSSSSGIGSSLNGHDTSPGDLATNGHAGATDANLAKIIEDRVQKKMNDQLTALTLENDNSRNRIAKLEAQIKELKRKHKAEIRQTKKQSWCSVCLKEANHHCCGGISYCSPECQLKDWDDQHESQCYRNKLNFSTR